MANDTPEEQPQQELRPHVLRSAMSARWLLTMLGAAAAVVSAAAPATQQFLSSNDSSWQRYVRAPKTRNVSPARILPEYTRGNVSNPGGLISGQEPTVLSRESSQDEVPTIVVDFGLNVAGLLSISFAGSKSYDNDSSSKALPGLTLTFSETLQFLGNRSDFTRSDHARGEQKYTNGTDQIAVKSHPYTWVNQLGCEHDRKVCADGLHGFRYVKIRLDALPGDAPYTTSSGEVSISSIKLQYSGFLGTPDTFTGNFECSDAEISQWWYDAVYTNDLCTDVFRANDTEPRDATSPTLLGKLVLHDGPKRDRDPYVGDLGVSALTLYLSHDAHEAARNVLEDLAIHQRDDGWIPPASINNYTLPLFDYPLWWVVCSRDLVFYTGDVSYAQTFYSVLVNTLDKFYVAHTNPATNLIERPEDYGDYAFIPRQGAVTYYNALYVQALTYAADLASVLGKSDDATRWRARAAGIGPALIKRNYDETAGAFFDGGSCAGAAICPTHAQDGNSHAILSGITANTTGMAESILQYLDTAMSRPYGNAFFDNTLYDAEGDFANRVYPFQSFFEIAARFSTSSTTVASAYDQLRRMYGWMASHDPTVTFWEGIGAEGKPYEDGFTSMSHGWATGIVPLMVTYVLGVTPTAPGFREWTVRPVTEGGGLTWARGVVPTPNGGIHVVWEKAEGSENAKTGAGGGFRMLVEAPEGTKGTVAVPVPDERSSVAVNGNVVYDGGKGGAARSGVQYQNGFIIVGVDGGSHDITVA